MTSPNSFNAPGSADFVKPQEFIGHLFIIRPLVHVPSVPGMRKDNGEPQDGIMVDGVILTAPGPDGQARTFRGQTWIHARLIGSLKASIGTMVLARVQQGTPKPGSRNNSIPLELTDATGDAQAVAAAQAWVDAHPGYFDTPLPSAPPVAPAPAPAPVQQQPAGYTFGQQPAPVPVGYAQPAPAFVPGFVPGAPVPPVQQYAQPAPVAPVQQAMPYGAPVAQPVPAAQPVPPTLAQAMAPVQPATPQVIPAATWDQLGPVGQQQMAQQGYTRGA